MEVLAAVATAPGVDFAIERLRLDAPRADEVLVRIVAVGICHTDIAAREGHMPLALPAVLGHEGAGVVVAVGSAVTKVLPGDHVVLTFRSCGACARCGSHDPAYCENGFPLNYIGTRPDGSNTLHRGDVPIGGSFFSQSSFADHVLAYERNIVVVADRGVDFALLAPLGCGVQTGAGAVLRSLKCRAGSSLLVTGGGSVGLSAVMAAVVAGCATIIVSDPVASRREMALALGATHTIDPGAGALETAVREIVPVGCDYAIDTTAHPTVLDAALRSLGALGTLGMIGVPERPDAPSPGSAIELLMRGLTIRGILEGDSDPDSFIPELIGYVRSGRFPLAKLVRTYPFADINQAIADQHDGHCVKPVLLMPGVGDTA